MKTCSRWRSRARFTSGLYSTENLGPGSGPEFGAGKLRLLSEIVPGTPSDVGGIELGITGLGEPPEPVLSIRGMRLWTRKIRRQNGADVEDVVEVFRACEGGTETPPASKFFLQSWQIFFRSLSSSS